MNRKLKIGYNTREVVNRINGNNLKFIPQLIIQGNWFADAFISGMMDRINTRKPNNLIDLKIINPK